MYKLRNTWGADRHQTLGASLETDPPSEPPEGNKPIDTLIWDFQPPKLR